MKVEILKDHVSGLQKGQVKTLTFKNANSLIKMGLAKELKEKESKPKKSTKKQ